MIPAAPFPDTCPTSAPPAPREMTCSLPSVRRPLSLLALPAVAIAYGAIALAANAQLAEAAPRSVHAGDELPDPDGKPADMSKPVQVYILLGQSNMLGDLPH